MAGLRRARRACDRALLDLRLRAFKLPKKKTKICVANLRGRAMIVVLPDGSTAPAAPGSSKKNESKTMINKIAIIGERVITSESQIHEAIKEVLDWNGKSERDEPLEVSSGENEDGTWSVFECWGSKVPNLTGPGTGVLQTFATEEEAMEAADAHNAKAYKEQESLIEWRELPLPISYIEFAGCRDGRYPQTRIAEINFEVGGVRFKAWSCASVSLVRQRHSAAALSQAVDNLIDMLTTIKSKPWTQWGRFRLSREQIRDVIARKQTA